MKKTILLTLLCLLGMSCPLFANNLTISNVKLKTQDTSANTILIQFDISWDNSWRDSVNYDAAWIFIKHNAAGTTTWNHVTLKTAGTNPTGFSAGSGTALEMIVPTDKKGCFLERSSLGSGSVSTTSVQLVWDYGADGYGSSDSTIANGTTQIQVFGIEMTYIPTGSFYVGDGGTGSLGEFEFGSTSSLPPQISSENGIAFKKASAGDWYYNSGGNAGEWATATAFNVSGSFPKGYHAFYLMKYEMSQKQYVDFLNTLTRDQQRNRVWANISGATVPSFYVMNNTSTPIGRTAITAPSTGNGTSASITFSIASSGYTNRAMNYINWMDLAAYADWAALRPMTEFEFEKAARGPIYPVSGEYAWGTTTIKHSTSVSCPTGVETGTEYNNTASANAVYNVSNWTGTCYVVAGIVSGPARTGFFATSSTTTRALSGAGYYGNMELSGNESERVVTVGNTTGLSFSGTHGDGILTDLSSYTYDGNATNIDWPGIDSVIDRGVTGAVGAGEAGASLAHSASSLQISDRSYRSFSYTTRVFYYGGRLVRTAPD